MKKIILFGATGNTGVYVLDYFLNNIDRSRYEVFGVGRKKTDFFLKNDINYIQMDICNSSDFDKLPNKDVFAVIHTAAKLPTHKSVNTSLDFINVNIVGTLNILEYCKKVSADRVIFSQTMSNIANLFGKASIIKPDTPRDFSFKGDHVIYVLTKNTAEDLVEHYHQEHGIKMFVFNIPTIYQYRENRYWYVNGVKRLRTFQRFIDFAAAGKPIEMWGDPSSYKDLVYVKDYSQLIFKAAFASSINKGKYNVGTGLPVRLDTMLREIVNIFSPEGKRSEIVYRPDKQNTSSYIIDVSNAKKDLGYEPKYNLVEMLRDIKDEMQENRFAILRENG